MTGVSVVIPNWNGLRYLPSLFRDLRRQTLAPAGVLVVDNASEDGSADWCEAHGARTIRLTSNAGFAEAVNLGVRASPTELVAVLNNDLELAPDWLERLTAGLADGVFAVGKLFMQANPALLDGTFDLVCRGGTAWRYGHGRADGPRWSEQQAVAVAPFTAILLRREPFLKLGGLATTFQSYLEDVDFGLRCASEGHTGRYVPDAVGWHAGSGTLGVWHPRTVRQISRNQVLLLARHYPRPLLIRFGWPIAVAHLLWGFAAMRHGAGIPWLRGKWEGLRMFRSERREGWSGLEELLIEQEAAIRRGQIETGGDRYWRWYFALT